MATHSSVPAWRIPETEEPGELLSMGSHRVRHDWSDSAAAAVWWGSASQEALVVKNLPANAEDVRDVGSIPGSGRSPGGGHGNPLQYSCWKIPWTEEPGGLQSIGSHRVRHDWRDLAHTHSVVRKCALEARKSSRPIWPRRISSRKVKFCAQAGFPLLRMQIFSNWRQALNEA